MYPSECGIPKNSSRDEKIFLSDQCKELEGINRMGKTRDNFIGDWTAKVGSQDISGVTGKFGLRVQNEAGQRIIEFCQENTLVIANTPSTAQEKTLHMDITRWSILKSD